MKSVEELPRILGIQDKYKGYHFIVTSIKLILEDENRLLFLSKSLFPLVAEEHHVNVKCVERDIRTVIETCWNFGGRKALQEITPYSLEKAPTVGEFLDILFWHSKKFLEK